jgi:PAS domain S-box-containing protein
MKSRDIELSPIPTLIRFLQEHPKGASIQEIAKELDMNRNLVAKYLSILHMQGRLELHTYGNIKIYQISNKIPFQSLSLLSEDCILGIDNSLCIRNLQGCVEEFFGIPEEHLSGRYIIDEQESSPFTSDLQGQIRNVLNGSVSHISIEELQLQECSVRVNLVPCIFDDGSAGVAFLCSKIAQSREQFREYYRLRFSYTSLLQDMQELYIELSPDWRVININSAFCEYCKKPAEHIIGTTGIPLISSQDLEMIHKSILELRDKVSVKHNISVVLEDGSVRWQEWVFYYHEYEGGKIGYHGFGLDISDRKLKESQIEIYQSGVEKLLHEKTEELRSVASQLRREIDDRRALEKELHKREELYRNLTESTSDIVWEINADKELVFVNDRTSSLLGYDPDQIIGTVILNYIPTDEHKQIKEQLHKSREQKIPFDAIRIQVLRKDGNYAWIEVAGVPIFGLDGSFQGFRGVGKDVTAKIIAELEQQQLISIIDSTPDLITMGDPEGNLRYLNKAGRKILGISDDTDITTLNIFPYTHPKYREFILNGRRTAVNQDFWMGDSVLEASNGRYIPVSVVILSHKILPGQKPLLSTIARDISERLKAEEQLAQAYAYNRNLIEISPDPLVTIGADGKIQDVNQATEVATGYSRDHLIGTSFSSYFTEPHNAEKGYEQVFSEGMVRDYPLKMRHKDGHTTCVLYNAVVYRDEHGEVQGVFAAARDMSWRIKVEQELARAKAYNQTLIEISPDPLVTTDADGKIQDTQNI